MNINTNIWFLPLFKGNYRGEYYSSLCVEEGSTLKHAQWIYYIILNLEKFKLPIVLRFIHQWRLYYLQNVLEASIYSKVFF